MLYNWFQNIEFKYEWVLPLLLALPVIAWFYYRTPVWRKSALKVSSASSFKVKTFKNSLIHFPFWLRLLAIGCVIVALARPQTRNVQSKTKGQGIDIVLCMDVSGSMLSNDFAPSRLEVAKQMASEFVRQRPVDQLGLVIFSGESFTQFPLSTDHEGLLEQIANLKSGMLIDGNEQPPETRLIDPVTALEIARTKGVKVYTIGLGAVGATTSSEKGLPKASNAFLDETMLRKIASQTGGVYFR